MRFVKTFIKCSKFGDKIQKDAYALYPEIKIRQIFESKI